jgi:hypothetical protein
MFAGVVLTVPLDLVFVPWADRNFDNGAIGGALAFVVTEVMMLVMGLWWVAPYLLNRRTMSRVARILFAGALLLLATWPTRNSSIVLTAVVGAVVYPVAIFAMRVPSDDEMAMLRRVTSRVLPAGVSKRIGN